MLCSLGRPRAGWIRASSNAQVLTDRHRQRPTPDRTADLYVKAPGLPRCAPPARYLHIDSLFCGVGHARVATDRLACMTSRSTSGVPQWALNLDNMLCSPLLIFVGLATVLQLGAALFAPEASLQPTFAYKQATRADVLRRQAVRASRPQGLRPRASETACDTCACSTTNSNGAYTLLARAAVYSYGQIVSLTNCTKRPISRATFWE